MVDPIKPYEDVAGNVVGVVEPDETITGHPVGGYVELRSPAGAYSYFFVRLDGKAYPLDWNNRRVPGAWLREEVARRNQMINDSPKPPAIDYLGITRSLCR